MKKNPHCDLWILPIVLYNHKIHASFVLQDAEDKQYNEHVFYLFVFFQIRLWGDQRNTEKPTEKCLLTRRMKEVNNSQKKISGC